MIRLRLRQADFARIRFAVSPLWECVASIRTLRRPPRATGASEWPRRLAHRARTVAVPDMGALVDNGSPYLTDFIAPPPLSAEPRFDEELVGMVRTPPRVVARELRRTRSRAATGSRAVAAFVTRLADELARWWDRVLRPEWPELRSLLQRDIIVRARRLALEGPEGVFRELHPGLRLRGSTISIDSRRELARAPAGKGLLLVPSVFGWPDLFVVADPPWQPTICYPARGVGASVVELPKQAALLERALGRPRARVLLATRAPATTGEIARGLRLTAGAVSQHLARLKEAGLVSAMRVGRFVFYEASPRAHGVVRAFEGDGTGERAFE